MALDKATVQRIASLARIKVSDGEQEHLARELSNIMDWIAQLNEVPTDGVQPMASVADMRLPMRDDAVTDGNIRERILKNAPQQNRGFFVVPKVVE
jgi:aspartyl-tRNA(Asn)/glutamyl-tRNA(Gln) amidotransferase subunit C